MSIANRATRLDREARAFTVADLELRDATEGFTFEGVASVVNTGYRVRDQWGDYVETILPGAFNRTLKQKADVRLLVNHSGVPLARSKSGTLKLTADPNLRATATLDPSNPTVQEIRSAMNRGDLDQMSIGFRVRDEEWSSDYSQRSIKEIELFDVSVVTYPASPTTSASLRSFDAFLAGIRDVEMTKDQAKRAIRNLNRRFADVWNEEVESWLELALKARFVTTPLAMVEVEDFNDQQVVFCLYGTETDGYWQLGYTLGADNTVTLDEADPVEVNEVVSYVPIRSTNAFLQRDRAEREALERKIAARPPMA
jgi:HK97 family phage prohead protease